MGRNFFTAKIGQDEDDVEVEDEDENHIDWNMLEQAVICLNRRNRLEYAGIGGNELEQEKQDLIGWTWMEMAETG